MVTGSNSVKKETKPKETKPKEIKPKETKTRLMSYIVKTTPQDWNHGGPLDPAAFEIH